MILFINACVRTESRTKRLADRLLAGLGDEVLEVRPAELELPPFDEAYLRRRDRLLAAGAFDDPIFDLARQFAAADKLVIAAPYWDLSFPAALKQYLERVNCVGLSFYYTPEGQPKTLCRAKQLWYVTTAGGPILSDAPGFGYVRLLAETFYEIRDLRQIKAENLDLVGADVPAILEEAERAIDRELERP